MNLGLEIVSSLLDSGDIVSLIDAGFTHSWLTSSATGSGVIFADDDKDAYQFILKYYERHRLVPSLKVFQMEFPAASYKLAPTIISISELIELASAKVKAYLTTDLIARAIDLRKADRIDDALSLLSSGAQNITSSGTLKISATNIASAAFDVEALLSQVMEEGIPFGIKPIDDEFFGFQPGMLITLIGRQKSGKTMATVNSAFHAWQRGYTVLFFSVEMSTKLITERFYSFGSQVSLSRMRRGHLRDSEKQRVREFQKEITSSDVARFIVSEKKSMITLDDIESEVRKYRPHIVYIDGFSFMVDRKTGRMTDDWQANENVAAELKSFAMENNVVVFVNTQAQEKQYSSAKGIEGKLIQGGTGLLKASDLVLGCNKEEGDVIIFNTTHSRFEQPPTVYVTVDWEQMSFRLMEPEPLESKGI